MKKQSLLGIDLSILFAATALIITGILFIYSSGINSAGELVSNEYLKQSLWAVTGFILLTAILFLDLNQVKSWTPYLYLGMILVLLMTLVAGKKVNGARSWIGFLSFGIQPSEFSKIIFILYLARFYDSHKKDSHTLGTYLKGICIMAIPAGLIMLQPDMGTALVYFPIFFAIAFMAGTKNRYILFIIATGLLAVLLTLIPAWNHFIAAEPLAFLKILDPGPLLWVLMGSVTVLLLLSITGWLWQKSEGFYWLSYAFLIILLGLCGSVGIRLFLKDYQMMRLVVFMDPQVDPRGNGWNIIQSITAVGSGGGSGKGFLGGTQSHYQYLPQQSTDFIFSIISEEMGFLGGLLILSLFGYIIIRSLFILLSVRNTFSSLVITGIVTMFLFHMFVNIGMTIGIMPITGIPLMFLSYGGSSLWTAMIGIGMILNIHLNRFNY